MVCRLSHTGKKASREMVFSIGYRRIYPDFSNPAQVALFYGVKSQASRVGAVQSRDCPIPSGPWQRPSGYVNHISIIRQNWGGNISNQLDLEACMR
jgi:hypothetical protein